MGDGAALSNSLLEVRQLEVVYNRVATAVQGISLEVASGGIVAMIGTNGAGKTTTLRAISGFLPAEDVVITDGSVVFAGAPIAGLMPHVISRRGVVLVPERSKLFETLSVEDNLHFNLTRERRAIRDRVYDYFPRLAERRSQFAGFLSGGEKQMLAIGMALVCEPKLLLVDELSLGLMPKMVDICLDVLMRLKREGLTIVLVEQNTARALEVADQVCVLSSGVQVFKGTSAEAKSAGSLFATFLGTTA